MCKFELVKNVDFGYLSVYPMPTKMELNEFYEESYYQKDTGQYSKTYSQDEINYFQSDCKVLDKLFELTFPQSKRKSFLDVGCGEGFQANYFHEKKWEITCSDYSDFGLKTHHSHLMDRLIKGDFEGLIKQLIERNDHYSIILLKNVLEHVVNPIETLNQLKKVRK